MKTIRHFPFLLILFVVGIISCEGVSVNKSIHIEDGETVQNDLSSVNGNVTVGDRCKVMGDCNSVNGAVRIGRDSEVDEISTVNGSILVGENTIIKEDLESVNGSITCERGVKVLDGINTVNGSIDLYSTEVEKNITTVNGSVNLSDRTLVMGNIEIEGKSKVLSGGRRVKIFIRGNSIVEGDIISGEDITVQVYLEKGSEIRGEIGNAELIEE